MLLMAQATYSLKFVNLSDQIAARADSSGVFDEFLKKMQSWNPVEQMSPDRSLDRRNDLLHRLPRYCIKTTFI